MTTLESLGSDVDRLARVALAHLVEAGSRELAVMLAEHGAASTLERLTSDGAAGPLGEVARARLGGREVSALVGEMLERTERIGARIVTPYDDEWPVQLEDLNRVGRDQGTRLDIDVRPPVCLWLRGRPPLAEVTERSVAVVGARASTAYGNQVAADLSYGLAERGWCVVSGGAYGIDAQAHRGALTAGGCTVVVLACGVDRTYPMAHANLFERVSEDGLLLSEWPPGADPHRYRFLIRNRVIAAMTRGTVVVEASARSGARQTAGRAEMLGRAVMAVPGPVTSAMSVGTHQILRGLGARLVTDAAEVIEEVGRIGDDLAPVVRGRERQRDRLGPTLNQVLDGVPARAAVDAQQIAATAGLPLRVVMRALPVLRADGFVAEDGGTWRLAPVRSAP
jgi:DNA processing protein